MSKRIQANQKHMDQDSRIIIEKRLDTAASFRVIGIELGKDPTTIAKEVRKHRIFQPRNTFNERPFRCANAADCHRKHVCTSVPFCKRECKGCIKCHSYCKDYVPYDYHCPLTDKAPFVCNGCRKKNGCRLDKYYYRAACAHKEYRTVLVESRRGINITEQELAALDATVSPLILKGQSPYLILRNHAEISQCEKTIYNYIDQGALSVCNLDLPKRVKYKPRKTHTAEIDDTGIFEGRSYKDYQAFLKEHPDTRTTEMDTVEGPEGSRKVLLTLHFCSAHFMTAFLLNSKEAAGVETAFDDINKAVGTELFCSAMPLILTDRGSEFRHPEALECGTDNVLRTSIYYCDPQASWQKPHCEKNHGYIRKICPKTTTTFDRLSQDDVNLMMSHINSAKRESLGGHSPLELAGMMLPDKLLKYFGLREIPADEINLTPDLLKGKIEV